MLSTDRALNMISALIRKAESSQYPEEKEAFLAHATALRAKYALEEAQLIEQDAKASSPINEAWDLCDASSPFYSRYAHMMRAIAEHTGIRIKFVWGQGVILVRAVGFPLDVRMAQLLWNAAGMTFQQRLEPKYDPNKSDAENVYLLRSSGMKRQRVADLVWPGDKAGCMRVTKVYAAECAARGEEVLLEGKGINLEVFRDRYADNFADEFQQRLRRAHDRAGEFGGGMVIHGRAQQVDEAYYLLFPEDRPRPKTDVAPVQRAVEVPCERCAKSKSGGCRQHPVYRWTQADEARSRRQWSSSAARLGGQAGRAAAQEVDLGGKERAKRIGN